MDLSLLQGFVAAAELGSLSRAAASLGIAQSALSRHLAALEADVGGRLFHRTGRGVLLTEIGHGMLPRAQALLQDARAMLDEARQVMVTPTGTVNLGLVPAWTHPVAGRLMTWQRDHYPGIRVHIHEGYSGEIEDWLASGRIDLGVFNRYRPGRRGQPQVTSRMQLVMRAEDPLVGRSVRFKALATVPLALPARPNGLRVMLDALCQRAGIELDVRLEANSSVAIKDAVLGGGLYSVLPPHGIAQERRLGLMTGVDIVEPGIRQVAVLDVTSHHPPSAAAREVWRVLPSLLRSGD